jgi:hypothetical protein
MQNFDIDTEDINKLTVNDIKSRLALIGAELDFQKHPKEYYKNLYKELLKDPNNRQTLKRYGAGKPTESSGGDVKLTSKKRQRGISFILYRRG